MSRIRAFTMPKWGIEMTEGTIAEWMVKEGDSFRQGGLLCLIETAKITNEVEAEYDGTVRRIIVDGGGGGAAPVGALLAVFDDGSHSEADIDAFVAGFRPAEGGVAQGASKAKTEPRPEPAGAAVPEGKKQRVKIDTNRPISPQALRLAQEEGVDITAIEGSGRSGRITHQDVTKALRGPAKPTLKGVVAVQEDDLRIFASPLARRIAAMNGIALAGVTGTGARGRISKSDVLALMSQPVPASAGTPEFVPGDNRPEVVPFDRLRKVVAQRLTAAKQEIPHFYLRMSASADALLEMRKTANLVLGCKASVNDWIIKASAMALVRHPDVNVQVHGSEIHRFPHADVAMAVASPRGLVTPVVRQANLMRIDQLAAETRRLIDKAQGKDGGKGLAMQEMEGGSFSVSNLGMFGIENFDAIINPSQGAILAVGAARRQPVETAGGGIAFETRISFTLSVDHRAIDGAAGAQFLQTFKGLIENPEGLFA